MECGTGYGHAVGAKLLRPRHGCSAFEEVQGDLNDAAVIDTLEK